MDISALPSQVSLVNYLKTETLYKRLSEDGFVPVYLHMKVNSHYRRVCNENHREIPVKLDYSYVIKREVYETSDELFDNFNNDTFILDGNVVFYKVNVAKRLLERNSVHFKCDTDHWRKEYYPIIKKIRYRINKANRALVSYEEEYFNTITGLGEKIYMYVPRVYKIIEKKLLGAQYVKFSLGVYPQVYVNEADMEVVKINFNKSANGLITFLLGIEPESRMTSIVEDAEINEFKGMISRYNDMVHEELQEEVYKKIKGNG